MITWKDITIEQWVEIEVTKKENIDILSKLIYLNDILGIRNMYDKIYDEMSLVDIKKELDNISFIRTQIPLIKPDNAIEMNSIVYGTYIDFYEYLTKERYLDFIKKVNCENNISYLFWYINEFNKYYNNLREMYPNIYPKTQIEEIDTSKIKNRKERFEIEQEQQKARTQNKYSWLNLLYVLADGDITKYDSIINTNNILVHNWLSLKIMKQNNII